MKPSKIQMVWCLDVLRVWRFEDLKVWKWRRDKKDNRVWKFEALHRYCQCNSLAHVQMFKLSILVQTFELSNFGYALLFPPLDLAIKLPARPRLTNSMFLLTLYGFQWLGIFLEIIGSCRIQIQFEQASYDYTHNMWQCRAARACEVKRVLT